MIFNLIKGAREKAIVLGFVTGKKKINFNSFFAHNFKIFANFVTDF